MKVVVRKLAVTTMVVLALTLTACTSSTFVSTMPQVMKIVLPVVDISATPPGWVHIDYGRAQISVPASWWYDSPTEASCPNNPIQGLVLAGALHPPTVPCPHPAPATSFASIAPLGVIPLSSRHLKQTIVNGIDVFIGSGGSTYYVPSLGVQVHASGPSARRVLRTLTRSPLDVALAKGPAPTVPASWRWYTFAGLRFAAPPYLARRTGDDRFDLGCPGVVPALSPDVFLIIATSAVAPGCFIPPSEVGGIRYINGVLVASGPDAFVQFPKSLASCRSLEGLTACVNTGDLGGVTTGIFGGVLDLTVVVPNRSRPTLFEIGLAGDGMVARTILYSLRPA